MATTFSERKNALTEISTRIQANSKRLKEARNQIITAEADLTALATAYSALITDINTDATANPGATAFTIMKLEKDQLISEAASLKTRSTNLLAAVNGVA